MWLIFYLLIDPYQLEFATIFDRAEKIQVHRGPRLPLSVLARGKITRLWQIDF